MSSAAGGDELVDRMNKHRRGRGEIGRKVEYVFHRRGNVIKEYYGAWRPACKRAGVSGRLVHDVRRTAVDRLEWSGVRLRAPGRARPFLSPLFAQ
jgi:hypothetical protein